MPADRGGPPIAAIASQKAPAPMPSSTRPPDRMSRLATAPASTAGGRSGRFATFGNTLIRDVVAAIAVSSVHVSRNAGWYGWSCTLTQSRPTSSARRASCTTCPAASAAGVTNIPNERS
jgi:hypothetical protein